MAIIARDPNGMLVRVRNVDATPEAYEQCVERKHSLCPISLGRAPRQGRCDCACHRFVAPV